MTTRLVVLCGAAALVMFGTGCKRFQRKHIPVESVQELAYPSCDGQPLPPLDVQGRGHLRSGPVHQDKTIVERFEFGRRGCMTAFTTRQEWPMGVADVEVLYDAELLPVRIWKRMTWPGVPDPARQLDVKRYELRTDPVEVKHRTMEGRIELEQLLGGKPRAVIGPGRGLLSMWIRRAKLAPGQKVRELVIDVRGLETIEPVTLLREADMNHPELGPVQVYTFYGRESVFTDAQGVVVGDLAGLRPDARLKTPAPAPIPLFVPLDPVHTP